MKHVFLVFTHKDSLWEAMIGDRYHMKHVFLVFTHKDSLWEAMIGDRYHMKHVFLSSHTKTVYGRP